MQKRKGFSLIEILVALAVLIITLAGGVVVWEKKVKPIPSPTPIAGSPSVVFPQQTAFPACEPMHDPCSDVYDPRWYYSLEKMECYQPHSQCEGSSFATKEECERHCLTTTKPILNGTWKLVAYKNLITGETETEPENIGRSIIIEFTDDGKRGKLQGRTVTNDVSGDYEILEGNKIKVLRFGGTKVNEPDWGDKFWEAMRRSSSYQIKGNFLLLYFNGDKELMEFVKQ